MKGWLPLLSLVASRRDLPAGLEQIDLPALASSGGDDEAFERFLRVPGRHRYNPGNEGFMARRLFALLAAISAFTLPAQAGDELGPEAHSSSSFEGHPDDPESRGRRPDRYAHSGRCNIVILAFRAVTTFRSDRRFFGRLEAEVRREEATAACKVLGAKPKFFPYAHETLVADEATLRAVSAWLDEVKPDVVVTHWPLDTHPNHHTVSSHLVLASLTRGREGVAGTCTSPR